LEHNGDEIIMRYTDSHEWVEVNGAEGKIGISSHAQKELGEAVYIELPRIGEIVEKGKEVAVIESTKAAADIYSPVSGKVVAVNQRLKEDLSLLNNSPEKEGWICKITLSNPNEIEELLDPTSYLSIFS